MSDEFEEMRNPVLREDMEVRDLARITETLLPMPEDVRARVLWYLNDRFSGDKKFPRVGGVESKWRFDCQKCGKGRVLGYEPAVDAKCPECGSGLWMATAVKPGTVTEVEVRDGESFKDAFDRVIGENLGTISDRVADQDRLEVERAANLLRARGYVVNKPGEANWHLPTLAGELRLHGYTVIGPDDGETVASGWLMQRGLVAVPREATRAMFEVGAAKMIDMHGKDPAEVAREVWRAMVEKGLEGR